MGYRDALTGLFSHTSFQLALRDRMKVADRTVCLALLDLDSFRSFNEFHGHRKGDELLVWLSELLEGELKDGEMAARFGGDEFALILNSESDITQRMERLRSQCEQDSRPVTLSIGVARYPRDARNIQEMLKAVDDALYVAKRGGRNQVVVSKSYEERNAKPLLEGGDNGATGAARVTPPSGLTGGGAVRLPD